MIFTQTLTRFGKNMLHYVILYHVDAKITSTLLANAIFKIITPQSPLINIIPNDRKWKFPFVSPLRYVRQMFSFMGFWNFCFQFVSLLIYPPYVHWISIYYSNVIGFQEEENDIGKQPDKNQIPKTERRKTKHLPRLYCLQPCDWGRKQKWKAHV